MTVEELKAKLEASERAAAAMREALEAFEARGIHADTNPSMSHTWDVITWFRYLDSADRTVRGIARRALSSDTSPKPENVDTSPGFAAEYSRGHRDARMAVDQALREAGLGGLDRGSLADIQVDIAAAGRLVGELRAERDELKKELEITQHAASAEAQHANELKKSLEWTVGHQDALEKNWSALVDIARNERDELKRENANLRERANNADREVGYKMFEKNELQSDLSAARAECAAVKDAATQMLQMVGRITMGTAADKPSQQEFDVVASRFNEVFSGASIGTSYRERVERLVEVSRRIVSKESADSSDVDDLWAALKEFEK